MRRAPGGEDRTGAAGSAVAGTGWNPIALDDVASLAWARAVFSSPQGRGSVVHRAASAFCWPGFAIGFLVARRGWFHRDSRGLIVRLVRRRHVRWWYFLAAYLVARTVMDVLRGLFGDTVLVVAGVVLGYSIAFGVCVWLRSREVRPKEERQGFLRPGGTPETPWLLERVEHRDGLDDDALRSVRALIDAVVPPGASVGAAPSSDLYERQLRTIGFQPVPGMRGHVVLGAGELSDAADQRRRSPAPGSPPRDPRARAAAARAARGAGR